MPHIVPEAQICLLTSMQAFREGWAGPAHFDAMLDTRDLLLLAAKAKNDSDVVEAARVINLALANIRDSWDGSKFAVSDDELNALQVLVDISTDFWARQSGNLYQMAYMTLRQYREQQNENQRNEAGTGQTGLVCG